MLENNIIENKIEKEQKANNQTNNIEENDTKSINSSINKWFNNLNLEMPINKKPRKRNYNEMFENSINRYEMNENICDNNELYISEDSDEIKPFKKSRKNKIYSKLLKQYNEILYYYTDNKKYEWEYLEINGTKLNYYFKCSTGICKGFGMIKRNNKLQKFKITKINDLPYYKHTYFIKAISPRKLINEQIKITEEEWKNEKIRINLFKWYFLNNKEDTEETCILYFTKSKISFSYKL